MIPIENFKDFLNLYLNVNNMSIAELARKLDTSRAALDSYIHDRTAPTFNAMSRIFSKLGVRMYIDYNVDEVINKQKENIVEPQKDRLHKNQAKPQYTLGSLKFNVQKKLNNIKSCDKESYVFRLLVLRLVSMTYNDKRDLCLLLGLNPDPEELQ